MEEQDESTVKATTAGNEEAFSEMAEGAIVPGNPEIIVPQLVFFPTAEGYYDYENFRYIYQYKDHLGNVRLSYVKNSQGDLEVMDSNDYYPFGLSIKASDRFSPVFDPMALPYNYKYNGKELQETGMYDYGARMYMPDIGRWGVVDPLAETSRRWSPYTYAYNNPIRFIDPDGMQNEDWIKRDNKWTYDAKITNVDQARAAGADAFAENGAVISNARIGSNGEAGYVQLNEGGTATSLAKISPNEIANFVDETLGFKVHDIKPETYYNFFTTGLGRSYEGMGQDLLKPGDKIKQVNFDEMVKPGAFPAVSTWGGKASATGEAVKNISDLFSIKNKPVDTIVPINFIYDSKLLNGTYVPVDTTMMLKIPRDGNGTYHSFFYNDTNPFAKPQIDSIKKSWGK